MTTNISSSLNAYSKVAQSQSQFDFPVKFPFKFTIEKVSINYKEIVPLNINANIHGTLLSIIPICSNVSSTANIHGTLKNNFNLSTSGLRCNSVMGPSTLINTLKLTSALAETANIGSSFTLKTNMVTNIITNTSYLGGQLQNYLNLVAQTLNANSDMGIPITLSNLDITCVEGTTNLIPSTNQSNLNGWVTLNHTNSGNTILNSDNNQYTLWNVSDEGYAYFDISTSLVVNGLSYTASIYVFSTCDYTFSFRFCGGQGTNTTYIPVTANTWTRLTKIVTYNSANNFPNRILVGYRDGDGALNPPVGMKVAYCLAQLEQKSHVTPFAVGTRAEGRVLETSNLTGTTKLNMAIISPIASIIDIDATDNIQLSLLGNTVSSIRISGQSILLSLINAGLTANSTISSTATYRISIVPQTINATGIITGIPTAIFKLVTNIIANTSIAINETSTNSLTSDFVSLTNITGNICKLISADVIVESDINNTFSFPVSFPFIIGAKVQSLAELSSNVLATSIIIDNSIQDLLMVNFAENSTINGQISCTYNITGNEIETSSITSNIALKFELDSSIEAVSGIIANIKNQANIFTNINSNSSINAVATLDLKLSKTIVENTNITSIIKNNTHLETSLLAVSNINNSSFIVTTPLTGSIQANSIVSCDGLLSNIELGGNIVCTSVINKVAVGKINAVIFKTFETEKSTMSDVTLDTSYSIDFCMALKFQTDIFRTESNSNNLEIKCIFDCIESLNVQLYDKINTVLIKNDTETVTFNSTIINNSVLNSTANFNAEFINSLNFISLKEE